MTFFLEGRQARIEGAEGRLTLAGHELRTLTLRGGVAVRLDDLEGDTEEATYDRSRDMITSPALVTIRGRTLEVSGRGMEVEVGPQLVRLLEHVHTTVRSDAAAS
jgi:lipopolysaccharide export system protein LptC